MSEGMVTRTYKDRLFVFIFGSRKDWTLSLYNAVNGTEYTDPEAIEYNTLKDVIYMSMKNDVSFLMLGVMNMWEQQSTFNPNLLLRFFIYLARLYEEYITNVYGWESIYRTKLLSLPTPKMVVFYNGEMDQPKERFLRLSDAFSGTIAPDIDISVRMININYDSNREIMKLCKPLSDYSWLVREIRRLVSEGHVLDEAVAAAINDMPEGEIKDFLIANESEVKTMMLTEYDEKAVLDVIGKDKYEDGLEDGQKKQKDEDDADIISSIHGVMNEFHISAERAMDIMRMSEGRKNRYRGKV